MKHLAIVFSMLLLAACAVVPKPEPETKRAQPHAELLAVCLALQLAE